MQINPICAMFGAMERPDFTLPDDVEALKAFALAMAQKAGVLEAEVANLKVENALSEARLQDLTQINADAEERIKNRTHPARSLRSVPK